MRQQVKSKDSRRNRRILDNSTLLDVVQDPHTEIPPLQPLNDAQRKYLNSIKSNTITFGIGVAGSGKSYCAAGFAADQLRERKIDKILLTRPAVEAGEKLGFLPGLLSEKLEPYLAPFMEIFYERLGKSQTEYLVKHGRIEAAPLSFMRGRSFKNCIAICDESQNLSRNQMLMFLTRIGQNCKVIIDGDPQQTDIPGTSGLLDAVHRLRGVPSIGVVYFTADDIVRSGIIKDILLRYQQD